MASAVSKEWKSLNDTLREADEAVCRLLLDKELSGSKRQRYLLRIHSRLNFVRAHSERAALTKGGTDMINGAMPEHLQELLDQSKADYDAMTPEERERMHQAQRESWVRGEMAMGNDADEAAYRANLND